RLGRFDAAPQLERGALANAAANDAQRNVQPLLQGSEDDRPCGERLNALGLDAVELGDISGRRTGQDPGHFVELVGAERAADDRAERAGAASDRERSLWGGR